MTDSRGIDVNADEESKATRSPNGSDLPPESDTTLSAVRAENTLMAEQIKISEERYRLLAEHANDVIWTMSLDGQITYVSPDVERMRGFTPAEAMNQPLDEIHTPESAAISSGYWVELAARLEAGLPAHNFRGELEYRCKDGSTVWTETQVIPHISASGQLIEILGVSRDISERKRQESMLKLARDEAEAASRALREANAELAHLATIDALTGVWNRRHGEQLLEKETARAKRYGTPVSAAFFDLDHFKVLNDAHGHQLGDQVLVEVTQRVSRGMRDADALVRWGGDEFVLIMPHCTLADAMQMAEKIRELVESEPFSQAGTVTISIGVAEFKTDESPDSWMRRADAAQYEAKSDLRNAVRSAVQ